MVRGAGGPDQPTFARRYRCGLDRPREHGGRGRRSAITDPAARTADPLECREGSGPGSAPPARRRRPGRGPGFEAAHPSIDCCESGDRPNVWIDTRGRVPSSNRCRRPGAYLAEQAMAGSRHRVDARQWATNLADALPAPRRRPGSLTSPVCDGATARQQAAIESVASASTGRFRDSHAPWRRLERQIGPSRRMESAVDPFEGPDVGAVSPPSPLNDRAWSAA